MSTMPRPVALGVFPAGMLPVVGTILGVLLIWAAAYLPSILDMAAIWSRSDTFAHGYVVLPISIYLIWIRRAGLVGRRPQPALLVLPLLLLVVVAWVLGKLTSIAALEHLSAVAVLVVGLWCALGHRLFRDLAFPLCFLMFMAPVGEFLVPVLMHYTAEFAVAAVRMSGVPVYQEGLQFVLPNGRWSVVEACSGIRYLIASFMVGTLYAYLNYQSLSKRLWFALVALLIPIVANWLRAYMIVMLGYLSDNRLAAGVDHLIYGWVFFGVVILAMFWLGNRWREAEPDYGLVVPDAGVRFGGGRMTISFVVLISALVMGPALGAWLKPVERSVDVSLGHPEAAANWQASDEPLVAFRPAFAGFRAQSNGRYMSTGGDVGLYVAFYAEQVAGHEMLSSDNQIVQGEKSPWYVVATAIEDSPVGKVRYERLNGPEGPLHVWRWYQIADEVLIGRIQAKLQLSWARLARDGDASAHVVLMVKDDTAEHARERAMAFMKDHRLALNAVLAAAATEAAR
ncbi:exosortase A [Denitromonas ohlonensis]|uniref:Exosortase A n=2 Tax=Denitromonas TaxID=139331 RepID=A0A557RCM6_9RHOO|nr:exosortase A [Denitromonas ohlonensis]TVO62894.1 exosortase A [Denitromonas ohlonensis]TVO74989.1 exosortase A [Denitromonas ohlonensis]TVT76019.1 MAG: exosortase A [Denitromonas halophila]